MKNCSYIDKFKVIDFSKIIFIHLIINLFFLKGSVNELSDNKVMNSENFYINLYSIRLLIRT